MTAHPQPTGLPLSLGRKHNTNTTVGHHPEASTLSLNDINTTPGPDFCSYIQMYVLRSIHATPKHRNNKVFPWRKHDTSSIRKTDSTLHWGYNYTDRKRKPHQPYHTRSNNISPFFLHMQPLRAVPPAFLQFVIRNLD